MGNYRFTKTAFLFVVSVLSLLWGLVDIYMGAAQPERTVLDIGRWGGFRQIGGGSSRDMGVFSLIFSGALGIWALVEAIIVLRKKDRHLRTWPRGRSLFWSIVIVGILSGFLAQLFR